MSLFGEAPAKEETLPQEPLREIKGFVEILHIYAKQEPSMASFFAGKKAYIGAGGAVRVPVQGGFAVQILESRKADEEIARLLKSRLNIDAKVVFTCDPTGLPNDVIDELNM